MQLLTMNTLILAGFVLLQTALVLTVQNKPVKLGDLIARVSDKTKGDYVEECSQRSIELGLVVDSSVSIEERDFHVGQNFLGDFLDAYDIGPGKNQVRVAAISFGRGVYVQDGFNLTTYVNKTDVVSHVTDMKFRFGGRTDTGDAIAYMRDVQMKNTRPWAPRFVIVLTDGNSQRTWWTKLQAERTLQSNISLFAVGVGSRVSKRELLNIVGGDPTRITRARSYDQLDDDLKNTLARKNCVLKPKPTTTTTTTTTTTPLPAIQPCREQYPSDINFIFNPRSLGVEATSWVTQFISHTITHQELESGFQYGVVSGDCPSDEGFELDRYSNVSDIRDHLALYDRNNLPDLVLNAASRGFTQDNGGRYNASKIAVIFVGETKMDFNKLNEAIQAVQREGVKVFVSRTHPGVALPAFPRGTLLLTHGSSLGQSQELVSHVCHLDLLPEGLEGYLAASF
ncbi:hypothetical protein ACOMHN_041529 [Nucella lapillus]